MNDCKKIKVVAVVGATASGKTALGAELALRFNGEVISADSMQIYKGMDIITAMPSPEEMRTVPHHLIGFLEPAESFSVARYTQLANAAADDIVSRGALPVVVGGPGLYIDSFLGNVRLMGGGADNDVRQKLGQRLENEGARALLEELKEVDEPAARALHENDSRRILRALELYYTTGSTKTQQNALSRTEPSRFDVLYICPDFADREVLYDRINRRVDKMLEDGLVAQARKLRELTGGTACAAIGCKELYPYFDTEKTLEECVEKLKRSTRQYAKRQMTWFRRNGELHRLYADRLSPCELIEEASRLVADFLKSDENDI